MYTIFDNEVPIYLTNSKEFSSSNFFFNKDDISIEKILILARKEQPESIYIYYNDEKELFKEFKKYFRVEKAAGGLVKNDDDEVLFIYRFNKWDLPKGKIEKGEKKKKAAIREVEEECGVNGLEIQKKLQKTYHIFQRKGRETLKITYWYEMKTAYNGTLVPQLEEGITDVVFKNQKEIKQALNNTYRNIQLLFQ